MFERLQPAPEDIAAYTRDAGLRVSLDYASFPLSFSKVRYLTIVRSRYMSLLSCFDDEQIDVGIAEIDERHLGEQLSFPDRFVFVRGVRRPAHYPYGLRRPTLRT